jgi:hypothetical protein
MEFFHATDNRSFRIMSKKNVHTLLAALALTVVAGASFAQTTPPAATGSTATPVLDQRQANQQARIDQGVASGQLTAKETNRLDKREAKLQADKTAAKADGKLTRAERRKLRREANKDSAAIYKQKHDAQTAAPAPAKAASK